MIDPHAITCRELTDFLLQYLAGEIRGRRRAVFEAHLAACDGCHAYLRGYEEAVRLGRDAFCSDEPIPEDLPEDLVHAVLAARKA
jgi:anti-sigma factor RsiW